MAWIKAAEVGSSSWSWDILKVELTGMVTGCMGGEQASFWFGQLKEYLCYWQKNDKKRGAWKEEEEMGMTSSGRAKFEIAMSNGQLDRRVWSPTQTWLDYSCRHHRHLPMGQWHTHQGWASQSLWEHLKKKAICFIKYIHNFSVLMLRVEDRTVLEWSTGKTHWGWGNKALTFCFLSISKNDTNCRGGVSFTKQ